MSYQLKLWDSKREREKINQPEHTAGHSQNKGTEQFQRRASRLQTSTSLPEAGGRREGKGANSSPDTASTTTLQTGLQFLTKDFLRFWMVNIHWEGHSETQGAGTRSARAGTGAGDAEGRRCTYRLARAETEAGTAEGRRHAAPGVSAPIKLLAA